MKKFINPRRISPIYEQEYEKNKEAIRRITHKEWLEIFPEAVSYLESDLITQLQKLDILGKIYANQLDINELKAKIYKFNQDDKDFAELITDIFIGEDIRAVEARIKEIERYLSPDRPTKGGVTESDIDSARNCDWEALITPTRRYKQNDFIAICPFHGDKEPSFLVRKGYGYCFGCNWSGDSIKFVMELEGINFIEAVKKLR